MRITIHSARWAVSPWQSRAPFYWSFMNKLRQEWFSNIRSDLLAGVVGALALIPEAIAFSIIAGVDPRVGLYASFCIAVVIAFAGGRPGMISAATGAMAQLTVRTLSTALPSDPETWHVHSPDPDILFGVPGASSRPQSDW